MIPKHTIDTIIEASDIVKIIGSYVKLEKRGKDYKACCPFHNEKTPSFSVRAVEQTYKCFGCGEGGNVVNFLMKYEQLSYPEAIKELGRRAGIEIAEVKLTEEEEQKFSLQKQIFNANEQAMIYFAKSLTKDRNEEYYNYAYSRMNEDSIRNFNIGYAPGNLLKHLSSLGFSKDVLVSAGLVNKLHDGTVTDKFRQRLVFPIKDERGLIVGFTCRTLDTSRQDKYNNTGTTLVYEKKSILFGLDLAKKAINQSGVCYLVEGNMDVITLNSIGVKNVVATSGTALNENQIHLLKKFGAKTIKIIPDIDEAGINAMHKNARLLVESQLGVKIILLPQEKCAVCNEDGKPLNVDGGILNLENDEKPMEKIIKQDADSFFRNRELSFFLEYEKNETEYLELFFVHNLVGKDLSPLDKSKIIKELIALIACYPTEVAALYLDSFSKVIKPAKMINDMYKNELQRKENELAKKRLAEARKHDDEKKKEIAAEKYIEDDSEKRAFLATILPEGANIDFYIQYGFYYIKNNYYFEYKPEKFFKKSNFILKPIAQIQSSGGKSRRVFEMLNEYNRKVTIDLNQEDLVSINGFKKTVESKGNFIFTGDGILLDKLKHYLYKETIECEEIEQLGWQRKQNFFAYGNGVLVDGEFKQVDEYGIIQTNSNHYYLPAFSKLNKDDETLYIEQKGFIHKEREDKPSFQYVSDKLIQLYGDNAKVLLCAYLGVLFKDIINRNNVKYPFINVFGVKGSGKTEFCQNFMYFFGQGLKEKKLDTTTIPAIAIYVSSVSNAFVHLDEYKNSIGSQKIELLKQMWDGTGRTKTNLDDITKTITSRVDCGIMMSGQELCTADNALLNRTCTITFFNDEFSEEERKRYKEFRELCKPGLTHITNSILDLRNVFEENFPSALKKAQEDLSEKTKNNVETRLLQNWSILLASFLALRNDISLQLDYNNLLKVFTDRLVEQNKISKSSSEVSIFWETVLTNVSNGRLRVGYDFKIFKVNIIKVDGKDIECENIRTIIELNTAKVFDQYSETVKKLNENVIPKKTMKSYLENSNTFIGTKKCSQFKLDVFEGDECKKNRIVTRSMVFYYDMLDIDLVDSSDITMENQGEHQDEVISKPIRQDLFTDNN